MKNLKGKVTYVINQRIMVLVDGKYYVILNFNGKDKPGDDIEFDVDSSLPMPSYLFAVATINEPELPTALEEIHDHWFGNWKK